MRHFLLATLLLGACYRPKIPDGSLRCGPGGLCPDGYVCNTLMVCAKPGGMGNDLAGGDGGALFTGKIGPLDLSGESGTLKCSTKTGEITLESTSGMTTSLFPPSVDGFTVVNQTGGPAVAIWPFTRVNIPAAITVRPTSQSDAIPVFATTGDLTIAGTMDWRTFGGFGNLAGMPGSGKMSGVDSGGGAGMGDGGGGGGGHSDVGMMGMGATGGVGGMPYGTPNLVPVHTGSGGGGGGNSGGNGGNGGGAIVLIANGTLTVSGKLDVSGNNGFMGGAPTGGGGGGGSGGSLLLSGTTVTLEAGHELIARGGKGGMGSGTGLPGGDGAAGRIWIGGQLSASGGVVADPPSTMEATPVSVFPAQ